MQFNKPATTFDDQIKLLQKRGMMITDTKTAKHYLSHLNYCRIGAYWLQHEADHGTHTFKKNTKCEDVVSLRDHISISTGRVLLLLITPPIIRSYQKPLSLTL